ncbi:hypothetical protein R54767_01733 [Paraburkholderia gardini]|uniref:Uncharacterized protein n=1 Tax=Paraburkholderia gardini TaxID=2823469 RepID=A0ABM8U1J4_9BURK|nr:hypothetical protein R54767_01733 [Paraburkholderia gardini]
MRVLVIVELWTGRKKYFPSRAVLSFNALSG